jgi:hypothetical protein
MDVSHETYSRNWDRVFAKPKISVRTVTEEEFEPIRQELLNEGPRCRRCNTPDYEIEKYGGKCKKCSELDEDLIGEKADEESKITFDDSRRSS